MVDDNHDNTLLMRELLSSRGYDVAIANSAEDGEQKLRNWHPGDELQQPGRASQKIKSLFQEFRVPIWERQPWPVLTSGNAIVWTRSFGAVMVGA